MSTTTLTAATWHGRLSELLALEAEAKHHDTLVHDSLQTAFSALFPAWPAVGAEDRARAQRWMEESGFNAACDRSDKLGEQIADLTGDLISEPAPDRAAALWKFRHLYTGVNAGTAWCEDFIAQANLDIEHFLRNI